MDLELLIQSLFEAETDESRAEILAAIEDPAAAAEEARTTGAGLLSGDVDAETLQAVEALAVTRDWLTGEVTRREEVAAEAEAAVAALRERLGADALASDDSTDDADETTDESGEAAAPEPDGDSDEAAVTAAETEPEPEPAAPAARRVPDLAAVRNFVPPASQPVEETPAPPRVRAIAGPDLGFRAAGSAFGSPDEIAAAMIERHESLGHGAGGDKVRVARLSYLDALPQASEDPNANALLFARAAGPEGRTLTASGGFCAPGENVYDFVKVNRPTNLVQDFLPTVGAPRGAVSYPTSPDIRDAFAIPTSRAYTEANDIAATAKTVVTVACPEWAECLVEAEYHILKFGNFATRALPEWVAHWNSLAMDAHEHLVSAKLATRMATLSDATVVIAASGGATATLLRNVGLAGADYRQDLRMDLAAPLDVMVPAWTYDAIRADLAVAGGKTGLDALAITNAQIDAWFAARNVTLRPVTDWQSTIGGGVAAGATTFPATLEFLIFAPGTFVKLDMGTLDLGLVRDSTLNSTNDYNIFVETFEQVCKPGLESRSYTLELCTNGAFSALEDLTCAGRSHGSS